MERLIIQIDKTEGEVTRSDFDAAIQFAQDSFEKIDPHGAPSTLDIEGGAIHITLNKF